MGSAARFRFSGVILSSCPLRQSFAALAFLTAAASAQDALEPLVVTGKAENLLGEADSASKGQSDREELLDRPYLRRGELLEVVPGMVVTQHAGGGKANQYFVRGYNLDHGTDFGIFVDGMPANYRAHGHGQGYADMNFLIPEFVQQLDYEKGPFDPRMGDLTTAGSAEFSLVNALDRGFASVTIGEDEYFRGVFGDSVKAGNGVLTFGAEATYYNGPWILEEDAHRFNGLVRWSTGNEDDYFDVTLLGYQAEWTSSDQIPERAILSGQIDRYGFLDPTNGGESQRYSLSMNWGRLCDDVRWRANAYAGYYDLDLYSNFTYFLDDPVNGDQFRQSDQRVFFGGEISATLENRSLFGAETDYTIGFQSRNDVIWDLELARTKARADVNPIRNDDVFTGNYSVFAAAHTKWNDWFRTEAGLRADAFYFDVDSDTPVNSGNEWDGIAVPKLNLIFGPWNDTEYYLNLGGGFHSNDARGLFTRIDPNDGVTPVAPVDPLVRTWGSELGVRHQWSDCLTLTASIWYIYSESELLYVGDAGNVEAGPSTDRYGIELAGYWRPNEWFSLDGEIALSEGRFTDTSAGAFVENQVPLILSSGITLGERTGPYGTLRARYFSERPLVADKTVESEDSLQFNARVGYRLENWDFAIDCLNLFDRADNDIEYYYTSRLPGEPAAGIDDVHLHPAEPRTLRASVTYYW
ncbi:TonB-dependent receptor plug domain-containing protein [Luteolibacter arcticus]|uniref:TonB-dependent receptor plug domain-containing protein n=1 Tax=Luteolibacter arcticus TaxID=1581411 RepID=A0ABT3GJI3_9BACT|nr:TonB-dependent receptor plug domain-containing protein [Luteolibacter arcticus]MCW1923662.1 TonB-dependent receptor plug domain-containing protein [Luteolibacter arcticus]